MPDVQRIDPVLVATDECGCVFGDGTLESPRVSCREPVGHRGEHRGRSLDGRYGARWPQAKQVDKREREWRYVMEGEKEALNQIHAKLATAVGALKGALGLIDRIADESRCVLHDEIEAEEERLQQALSEIEQGDTK